MKLDLTRRDVLKFAAGGTVGAMLTPVPWKALDDVAIWTQNWSWIPKPPRGPVTMRATACALCPAGCALQARCVGGLPVSMHAADGGGLCPAGLTGHHLPYHPARLTRPMRILHDGTTMTRRIPVQLDAAVAAATGAIRDARKNGRTIAVIDTRPGRSISWAWQQFLAAEPDSVYIPAPGRDGARFPAGTGLDSASTIVSFRAPIAEGWGSPSLRSRVIDRKVRLIQIDPGQTATAAVATRWVPARPGSEATLALALLSIIDPSATGAVSPRLAAAISGIPEETIESIAREIASNTPAIVVADSGLGRAADDAFASLNALLGNGTIASNELPAPFESDLEARSLELDDVKDGSIALLVIDMSAGDARFPWPAAARKLAKNSVIIALTPFLAGTARKAHYVVPTAPFLEAVHELPATFDATAPRLTVSAAILPPRHAAIDPAAFIRAIAPNAPGDWTTSEQLMRARVARIHESRRGRIGEKSAADFATADEMWDALLAGTPWIGEPQRVAKATYARPEIAAPAALPQFSLVIRTPREITATAAVSPVMSKLYRESSLRRSANVVAVNPRTAKQLGLEDGSMAKLVVNGSALRVRIATDQTVMPGVAEMTIAPDRIELGEDGASDTQGILDIVRPDAGGCWRTVAARLVEA